MENENEQSQFKKIKNWNAKNVHQRFEEDEVSYTAVDLEPIPKKVPYKEITESNDISVFIFYLLNFLIFKLKKVMNTSN